MMKNEKLKYLEDDLNKCAKCIAIGEALFTNSFLNYSSTGTLTELLACIGKLKDDVQDQYKRFHKPQNEIAVVSDKRSVSSSAAINAWLQIDFLPSDKQVLVPVELISCDDEKDQRYITEYLTEYEFDRQTERVAEGLFHLSTPAKNSILKELENLKQSKEKLGKFLTGSTETKRFSSFDEVKKEIVKVITDPIHARTIKNISIWAVKLHSNTIMHILPDYESIWLDREQAVDNILNSDLVLYIKEFNSPDITDMEAELIKTTSYNNQFVRTKDKTIVVLTSLDVTEDKEAMAAHTHNWTAMGIESDRILRVSPIKPKNQLKEKDTTPIDNEDSFTGYAELNSVMNKCIDDFKTTNAIEQCNDIKTRLRGFCLKLSDFLSKECNIDVEREILDALGVSEMEKTFNEWWAGEWKSIKEDFQIFFQTDIRPKQSIDHYNDESEFKRVYDESIDRVYRAIPAVRRERQKSIFITCMGDEGIVAPKEANNQIRIELARDSMFNLDRISMDLTIYMVKNVGKIVEWVKSRLWNMPEIREELVGNDERFVEKVTRRSYEALIQRLLRPTTDLFLRYPRSKIERIRAMKEYQIELNIIDNFIENGRIKRRGIVNFLANGELGPFLLEHTNSEKWLALNEKSKSGVDTRSITSKDVKPAKRMFSLFHKKKKKLKESEVFLSLAETSSIVSDRMKSVVDAAVEPGKAGEEPSKLKNVYDLRLNFEKLEFIFKPWSETTTKYL
jgi:hypothetical protein